MFGNILLKKHTLNTHITQIWKARFKMQSARESTIMRNGNRTFNAAVISHFTVRFSTPVFLFLHEANLCCTKRMTWPAVGGSSAALNQAHGLWKAHCIVLPPFRNAIKIWLLNQSHYFSKGKHFSLMARHSPSNTSDREVRSVLNYFLNGPNVYSVPSYAIRTTNSVSTFTQTIVWSEIWRQKVHAGYLWPIYIDYVTISLFCKAI
jgi:hypothetical protein